MSMVIFEGDWKERHNTYSLRVRLEKEGCGGFSATLPNLPGVASQGDTEQEALSNIAEAFKGAFLSYRDAGKPIPWRRDDVEVIRVSYEKVIIVDCSEEATL